MGASLDRYLAAIRKQVATTLRPKAMGDLAGKHSLYTERVLNYLAVETRDLPQFQKKWLGQSRALSPLLSSALRKSPSLHGELETALETHADFERCYRLMHAAVDGLQAVTDAASIDLLARIGNIELQLQEGFATAIARESVAVTADADADEGLSETQKRKLTELLQSRFPEDKVLAIASFKAIPGGFSKQTIFLQLQNARSLPESVVLRIDKADSPVETTVADEFEIIAAMYRAGVPVPQPLLLETDKSILGGAFEIVGRIDGVVAGDAFEVADPQRSFAISLARGLAKMHSVPESSISKRVPGANVSVQERMLADINVFEQKWRASKQPSLTLGMAYGWLRANISAASTGRRAIVHRDAGCHNLLVKDGQLAAILDWETALIGDPAQDIGYAYHTVIQMMPWEEFLDEYVAAGGSRPTQAQLDFYRVWRHVWLMTMQTQAKSAIDAGYTDDMGLLYNVLNLFQRLTVSLQQLLCEIGTGRPENQAT